MSRRTRPGDRRRSFGQVAVLPSGRFRARYTGPDGKRRTGPATFATRAEADAYLVQVHAEMLRGNTLAVAPTMTTLADYAAAWLRTAATGLRPRTLELYQRTAARWIIPQVGRIELGTLPLSALTVSLVREWHTELVAATHAAATATTGQGRRTHPARAWARAQGFEVADTGKLPAAVVDAWTAAGAPAAESVTGPVDPEHAATAGRTAAAQAYRLLRTMLAQAVRDGLIPTNPAQVKGAATAPHPERIPLTAPEVTALAEAVAPRFRAAVLVAAWSGLRPGELFALQRADVDPEAGTVTVRRTLVQVTGQPVSYGPPKTSAGRRTVALPGSVTAALAAHLETYTGPDPAALVFTTATGQPVTSTRRTRALAPARESIGRPDISWHHLRHTGATLAAITGATQAELQRRIGHASPRAAALYQHASTTRDHWIATQLDTLAGTPTPPPPPTEPGPAPLTPDTPTPTPVTHRPRPHGPGWAELAEGHAAGLRSMGLQPGLTDDLVDALDRLLNTGPLAEVTPAEVTTEVLTAALDTCPDTAAWSMARRALGTLAATFPEVLGHGIDPTDGLTRTPPAHLPAPAPLDPDEPGTIPTGYTARAHGHLTVISRTA